MKTKLDKLIESIDPSVTLDQVSAEVDAALNSFQAQPGTIQQLDDFKALLARFYCHAENFILHFDPPRNPDPVFDLFRCEELMKKEYGDNGLNVAFNMVQTGLEGGLYAVIKAVANQMAEEYAGNQIRSEIFDFWESLSAGEMVPVFEEYLDKYGHLLPSELLEQGAGRLFMFFWKTLEEHPRIVRRLRNVR